MPTFSNEDLTRWKKEINAGPIIASRIKIRRENSEYVGLCPFHEEKSASFKVWRMEDGVWAYKCFGCGANGNVFQFIQKYDKIPFTSAVEEVLKLAGVSGWEDGRAQSETVDTSEPAVKTVVTYPAAVYAPAEQGLERSTEGRKWLAARGIGYSTARKLHLGFVQSCKDISPSHEWRDDGWVLFPSFSEDGKTVVSVKYRSLVAKKEKTPEKEISGILRSLNTATVLYNLFSITPQEDVFVVEGEPDTAVLSQIGIPCAGYPSNSYKPTDEECAVLQRAKRRFLAGDSDKGGKAAMDALGKRIPEGTYIIHWPEGCKDANDALLKICNSDTTAFAELIEQLKTDALEHPLAQETVIRKGDEIRLKKIKWLWHERVPLGKITLFAGNPDNGKSLVTANMAAIVTNGKPFPGQVTGHAPADVLMLIGEDDLDDTTVPRLMAAGADRSRILFMEAIKQTTGDESEIRLDMHMQALEKQLEMNPNIRLVVIDPISNYLGDVSMVAEQESRGILIPLKRMAARHNVAIVIVMHLNKKNELDAISRVGGAMAFIGVARCSWLFVRDTAPEPEEGEDRRVLNSFTMLRIKNNLAFADKTGLAYTITARPVTIPGEGEVMEPYVEWGEAVCESADDALGGPAKRSKPGRPSGPSPKHDKAVQWLQKALQDGPRPANELIKEAKAGEGFSEEMLRAAKDELKVTHEKLIAAPGKVMYMWKLPKVNATIAALVGKPESHATEIDDGEGNLF